ncbi:MAG: HWE histidine kinase domain-containing protein [Paracoccus sp. (in: a-proteobacteria)]|uniref:HWE histidine kinase domain-containing protein n=1 Tax=Paracoccus sp. TaxID=267 RepID=UPI0039E5645D
MTRDAGWDAALAGRRIDLTNCDREPIHIPGSIQPHGCLLACDGIAGVIGRHSANAAQMLGLPGAPLGRRLSDVIGVARAHAIANALAILGPVPRPALLFDQQVNGRAFDVTAHHQAGRIIIEFEPASRDLGRTLGLARTVMGRIRAQDNPQRLLQQATALIQAQLGYDRVMIYELGPDGAGKVVSEAKTEALESFLGQYFPASDIPRQARALYLRNPIRMIGDVHYRPVPILPAQDEAGPLDLSHAHLRSASPIHCEYLRNMGVGASMSVSIIIDGALWGLIACHHYTPRILRLADRAAAEMVGEFFSLHLNTLRRRHAREAETAARRALDDLMVDASRGEGIGIALRHRLPLLSGLIPSAGIALWFDGEWSALGHAPDEALAAPLIALARAAPEGQVFQTDRLAELLPGATALTELAAGVLIVPLSRRPRDFLFYFRREAVQTLDWAGDPGKTYPAGAFGDRLTPRKSFALWKETVRQRSHAWADSDRSFAEAFRIAVVEVLLFNSELLADERARAAVRQRVLNQELNHRVKNILAVIRALASVPTREGETLANYSEALRARIQAMAYAHDQVVRDENGGDLLELLRAELSPYLARQNPVELRGPGLTLDGRAFSVLALVVHELATNAAKYGALSRSDSRLDVTWDLDAAGDCHLHWRESGVEGVEAPAARGFGSTLIERSVPYDLGGQSRIEFGADGLAAEFVLPAHFVRPHQGTPAAAVAAAQTTAPTPPPGPPPSLPPEGRRRVLLVEDQVLIAMSLEAELKDHGFDVTGIAPNVDAALELIRKDPPDLAVLDVNLRRETSLRVAEALLARGVHFVFATGYGADFDLPPEFARVPVVEKPYNVGDVLEKLRRD